MNDYSIAIVPKQSTYANNEQAAKEILQWLVEIDLVNPTRSDCILSSELGYSISNGAKNVVIEPEYLPFDLIVNGLQIVTERRIFHTGENGIETLICPNCKENIAGENWDFFNPRSEGATDCLICPMQQ